MAETMALFPFHLAVPVTDLAAAEHFYVQVVGCATGRRSEQWIDLNLFGHQLVCHTVAANTSSQPRGADSMYWPPPYDIPADAQINSSQSTAHCGGRWHSRRLEHKNVQRRLGQ